MVASAAHTYLNIQADAREGVKEVVKQKRRMRHTRRGRKTPYRQPRRNRKRGAKRLPPSTRARGPRKLRLAAWLCQLFPVIVFVVEEIKTTTRGKKRWDQSFSPLEVGKAWFYGELAKLAPVQTKQGYETKELREQLGLKKSGRKTAEVWEAHCVDACKPIKLLRWKTRLAPLSAVKGRTPASSPACQPRSIPLYGPAGWGDAVRSGKIDNGDQ